MDYQELKQIYKQYQSGQITATDLQEAAAQFAANKTVRQQTVNRLLKSHTPTFSRLMADLTPEETPETKLDETPDNKKPTLIATGKNWQAVLEGLAKGDITLDDVANNFNVSKSAWKYLTTNFNK